MSIPEKEAIVKEVMGQYDFPGTVEEVTRNNGGHINDTFTVVCKTQEGETRRFILQGLSLVAFPRQKELMENFIGVTSHLRKKIEAAGGDPMRETLNLVYTRDGKPYYTEESGKVWRVMPFVEGTLCLGKATPNCLKLPPGPLAASRACWQITLPSPSMKPS